MSTAHHPITASDRLEREAFIRAEVPATAGLPRYAIAILRRRARRNMSATQLAFLTDRRAETVSRWENGRRCPSHRSSIRLCMVLGGAAEDYTDTTPCTLADILLGYDLGEEHPCSS